MKNRIGLISIIILFFVNNGIAQNLEVFGDTVQFKISGYHEGQITWQFSNNLTEWSDIPISNKVNFAYKIKETGYFRALINTCQGKTIISDTTYIKAIPPKIDESFFNKNTYLGKKTPVFTKGDIRFCNVKVPSGYQQSQTHPSIIYTEKGWNGYDHWLVTTPYPNADYSYENPCIYYGSSFSSGVPPSDFNPIISNPIQNQPKGGFNSDTDLFLENDTLYCIFRQSQTVTNYVIKKSVNGQSWTDSKTIFKNTDVQGINDVAAVSPSVFKENGKYRIYTAKTDAWITVRGTFKKFFIMESDKIDGTYKYVGEAGFNNQDSIQLWHFDIFDYNNTLYMVLCAINNSGNLYKMYTYLAVSYDRKNFNIFPKPLFSDFGTYRPTFYINDKNLFVLYLSIYDTSAKTYSIDGREIGVVSMDFSNLLRKLKDNN